MSYELTPSPQPPSGISPGHSAEPCQYCGAPLSDFYYFCLACGTPYKSPSTVLTPARPRQLTDGELISIKTPQVATLFWSYFSVVIGVGLFTTLFFREERLDLQLFLNEIAILATTCVFGWVYRKSLIVQFKAIGFDHAFAYVALATLAPMLLLNYAYHGFLTELIKVKDVDFLTKLRQTGVREASLIATFCVFPAILEEIAYRGLMQHWLQTAIEPGKALVVASFLFAATHLTILSLPYLFLLGLLLGYTKQRTGSLYPSMLIHFLHNLIVIEFFPLG